MCVKRGGNTSSDQHAVADGQVQELLSSICVDVECKSVCA